MAVKVTIQNGQFQDAAGVAIVGTLVLQLSQDAVVSGTGQVAPKAISIVVTAGQAAATPVWGNDNLTPAGTTYTARLFDTSGALVWGPENWSITGAGPIEINTLVPSSSSVSYSGAVVLSPSGNQTITAGNLLPASSNSTQSLGSVAAPWLGEFKSLNGVVFADAFSGDIAAQISAAIATLPSSGGCVDARGIIGSQTTSTTIAVGTPSKPVCLLLGQLTINSTANPVISIAAGSMVCGSGRTQTIIANNGTSADAIVINGMRAVVRDLNILGGAGSRHGIYVQATSSLATEFTSIQNCQLSGPQNSNVGIKLEAYDASHLCSFTSIINCETVDYLNSVEFTTGSSVGATDNYIFGGQFRKTSTAGTGFLFTNGQTNYVFGAELSGHATGVSLPGANAAGNGFSGTVLENNTVHVNAAAGSADNHFWGGVIPTWTDNGARNIFFVTNNSQGSGGTSAAQITGVPLLPFAAGGGTAGLPTSTGTNMWFAGNIGSPTLGRIYVGDGSGWQMSFAKRTGSADTDLVTIKDSGVVALTGTLSVAGATPTGTGTQLGVGNTTGFGNGAAGTAVTTTLKNTGTGPTTPQTVVKYLQIDIGGTKYYIPLVQ
jgi:hypothetical protein